MNVMAAICNSFSGRRSFASLTRPQLNERAPAEEAGVPNNPMKYQDENFIGAFSVALVGPMIILAKTQ